MKFVPVTEHYGYCYERVGGDNLYVVYNIQNGKPDRVISGFQTRSLARRECRYLEKLNAPKFEKIRRNCNDLSRKIKT